MNPDITQNTGTAAMLAVFSRVDKRLRKSITFDNDTAFAQHGLLRTVRDMATWLTGSARALFLSLSAFGYYRFEYSGLRQG
jgi:IS30 family transposase